MIPGSHGRTGSHGCRGSAGEEACDHRGGEVGEIVQGVEEAQADVLCSSSVQYRTVYVYVCAWERKYMYMYMVCMYVCVCVYTCANVWSLVCVCVRASV